MAARKAVFLLQTDPYFPKPVLRALREANSLAHEGFEVAFVSWIKGSPPPAEHYDEYPTSRVEVPVPTLGKSFLRRSFAYVRASGRLRDAAVGERPTLIIAHDFEVLSAAVAAGRLSGAPVIYDSHEDWPALIAEKSPFEARIAKIQETRLCRSVAHVVTVSEPIAEKFRSIRKPTTVLYNARPSTEIHMADRETSRTSFGYGPDDFVVGFAGSLEKDPEVDVFLEALARLPPPYKGLIVGGPDSKAGSYRERARALGADQRIRLVGYRPFKDLAPFYAAMDVGTILLDPRPNHLRALPNKLFDYLAHGVPVLVPNYPAISTLVRDTMSGWVLHSIEPNAVAKVLLEVRDSGERTTRGQAGRRAFLEKFAWENQDARFLRIADFPVRTH